MESHFPAQQSQTTTSLGRQFLSALAGGIGSHNQTDDNDSSHDAYAERNLSSLGAVLLIPAVIAVFGGFVFARYLGASWWLAAPFALLWGLIILAIDRHLVLTTPVPLPRVTEESGRGWSRPLRTLGHVGIRLLLALFLGTLNGHLVGLRLFDDVISEELHDQLSAARAQVDSSFDQQHSDINTGITTLEQQLETDRQRLAQLDATAAAEIAGSTDLPGTTGIRGAGEVYQRYEVALDNARQQVAQRRQELESRRAEIAPQVFSLDERQQAALAEVDLTFGTGVAARSSALVDLSRRESHIGLLFGFLLLMLVTIEVLPVVLKLLTPVTAADQHFALASWERQQDIAVHKEAVLSTHDLRIASAKRRMQAEQLVDEMANT